ncbi:PhoH family protein [Alkalihalobacillus sp. NPDC078783]
MKAFILDTNILLSDPNAINAFGENTVIIPTVVLQELDRKKKQMDEIGFNARQVARNLEILRQKGKLNEYVDLENGGRLKVIEPPSSSSVYSNFLDKEADSKIVATAKSYRDSSPFEVVLVSKDVNVRIKADASGVPAEDYEHDKVVNSKEEHYTGMNIYETNAGEIAKFVKYGTTTFSSEHALPNEFTVFKNGSQEELGIERDGTIKPLYNYNSVDPVFGLQAKNVEQQMALELLLDDNIPLVTLTGKAGTGKTLLSLAAGLKKSLDDGVYRKVIVSRPVVPMGKDIGYLPGEKEEKLRPWMQPIYDNLEYLFDCNSDEELAKAMTGYEDMIEVEALTYIRGRSIPEQFFIIDEAQNLTKHEVKTIITRAGEGTKIVLVGDVNQIDHPYLDQFSNGLTYVIEKMKQLKETGHVSLTKGERSNLAQLAADLLN